MAGISAGGISFGSVMSLVWSRLAPNWAQRKIDSHLYLPSAENRKGFRLPRGFQQKFITTPDGQICTYRVGEGPAVVFVHDWGGGSYEFFSIMRALKQCGFTAIAFDHFGHEASEAKPATLHQLIRTTNHVLNIVKKSHADGLSCVVAHGLGCMVAANATHAVLDRTPLFFIAPIFNYRSYFLQKLNSLKLHPEILKKNAEEFTRVYPRQFAKLELAKRLHKYADDAVIAHDANDSVAPIAETLKFTQKHPLTKLLITKKLDHRRIVTSESVWQELKSHIHYEDTTVNFAGMLLSDSMGQGRNY